MKRRFLCMFLALTMLVSMPAAVFASDNLVSSNNVDGWRPASAFDLLEQALMEEKAKTDSSIIIYDEKNGPAPVEAEPIIGENMRTVDIGQVLADEEMEIAPMKVSSSTIGATRESNTKASVTGYAIFTQKASTAKCSIYLQEKYNGSWRTATGIPVIAYIKTVNDTKTILATRTFTVAKGKVYRAKVTFTDTNSSGTYTKTRYTSSF
jgi:hypothetical protein